MLCFVTASSEQPFKNVVPAETETATSPQEAQTTWSRDLAAVPHGAGKVRFGIFANMI